MIVEKFTITMEMKRSHNFQSTGASLSIEVALEEGENYLEKAAEVRREIRHFLDTTVESNITSLVERSRNDI